MSRVAPLSARLLRFASAGSDHLFFVTGSRIFDVDPRTAAAVDAALRLDDESLLPPSVKAALAQHPERLQPLPQAPAIAALSLNLIQACNMGCGYCYAEQGGFGGPKRAMSVATARRSVDRLIDSVRPGGRAVLAFMGGEPFLARDLLHEIAHYAWDTAQSAGRSIAFAVTTNATMLTDEDASLLARYPFSVTVSIDGPPEIQDRQRPMLKGAPSSERVARGIAKLLANRPRELTARMSVMASTGPLQPVLDHVLSLGFDSAGFSPVVAAPHADAELSAAALAQFTDEMIRCGEHALDEWLAGRPYRFSNLEAAMSELHRGAVRAHPCGAGAGYLSIDADGEAFACHRLVGDERFHFGNTSDGVDDAARLAHLTRRAVDSQEPCRTCWARYLCGGGCYHEVANRGRVACDHVRQWLSFCLRAYAELSQARPGLFDPAAGEAASVTFDQRASTI
jgi:uncharacterized protein